MFFFLSLAILYCMRKVGYAIGLVDKPMHENSILGVCRWLGEFPYALLFCILFIPIQMS